MKIEEMSEDFRKGYKEYMRYYYRKRAGYSEEEAKKSVDDFKGNSSNIRSVIMFEGKSLANWADELGVKYNTLYNFYRKHSDWSFDEIKAFYQGRKQR